MSTNDSLNKTLKRTADVLEDIKAPVKTLSKTSVKASDVAQGIVADAVTQTATNVVRIVDIAADRLREAQRAKKTASFVQTQLDRSSTDIRFLSDSSKQSFSILANGVADLVDVVAEGFRQLRTKEGQSARPKQAKAKQAKTRQKSKRKLKAA